MTDAARESTTTRVLPVVRLEHLWVLLALSVIGVFISLVPTDPNDFWWHLKAGQLVATDGIPSTNRFAWTVPADTPFVYQSWLGEWLLYMLSVIGGLPLTVFARNALGLAAFTLVAVEAHNRTGSWRLAAGAVLLAAAMSLNNLSTRTQIWSWLLFTLLLVLLGSYTRGRLHPRWLVVLPLLMVFWVNAHGAFVIGLAVTAAFVVGETLEYILRRPRAMPQRRLRLLYGAAGAMLLATLANPQGIGIFGYVQQILSDAPIQQLIIEWQPPDPETLAGTFFVFGVLVLLAAFAFARRRPGIADVLLVCGLGWMAFNGVRSVIWFGMAAMPIAAQCFAPLSEPALPRSGVGTRHASPVTALPNLVMAVVLLLGVVVMQPWFKAVLPLPQPYQEIFAPVPGAPQLFEADTPVLATEYLRNEPCGGRLLNELGYGSYLIWALYPDEQVFIDPRIELYPIDIWHDYVSLTEGREVAFLLDQYDIECVLLDRIHQPRLAAELSDIPEWRRTYHDTRSEVWRRGAP